MEMRSTCGKIIMTEKSAAESTAAPNGPQGRGSCVSRASVAVVMTNARRHPARLLGLERQKRYRTRPLDGERDLALVLGAGSEHAPGEDLAAVGHEADQRLDVLVVDVVDLLLAELADLAAP